MIERCFSTKWYIDVLGGIGKEDDSSSTGFLNLTLSFAMTKSLVSDSDKFKIIIMLHQMRKIGDTGPYENLIYCNPRVRIDRGLGV